jgi:hypothetical protein
VSSAGWRAILVRRLGWSFAAATLWTWGLLGLRMLRDGLQPLEVWFSYSLSFFMTAVYVYLGLLIYATIQAEAGGRGEAGTRGRGDPETGGRAGAETGGRWEALRLRVARAYRPLSALGLLGLAIALTSLVSWLLLRYPGPQAVSGTYGSVVLALMILGVAVVSTYIARSAER